MELEKHYCPNKSHVEKCIAVLLQAWCHTKNLHSKIQICKKYIFSTANLSRCNKAFFLSIFNHAQSNPDWE